MGRLCADVDESFTSLFDLPVDADAERRREALEESLSGTADGIRRFARTWVDGDERSGAEFAEQIDEVLDSIGSRASALQPSADVGDRSFLVSVLLDTFLRSGLLVGPVVDDGTFDPDSERLAIERYRRFREAYAAEPACTFDKESVQPSLFASAQRWIDPVLLTPSGSMFGLGSGPFASANDVLLTFAALTEEVTLDTFWFNAGNVPADANCPALDLLGPQSGTEARVLVGSNGLELTLFRFNQNEGDGPPDYAFTIEHWAWPAVSLPDDAEPLRINSQLSSEDQAADFAQVFADWSELVSESGAPTQFAIDAGSPDAVVFSFGDRLQQIEFAEDLTDASSCRLSFSG